MTGIPPPGFSNLGDLPRAASRKLPLDIWDYIEGGAAEETTLRANRSAFQRRTLRPRVLVDITELDPTTEILGQEVSAPDRKSTRLNSSHEQ
jgi:isopentenyl diphosphate isomerase/L-lactate dehydrogenase-like FMN-dependent dehydrogenase